MSSTYSSNVAVGTFTTKKGTKLVFLWEETCESNVSPRDPRWHIGFIGLAEKALDKVFRYASSCEGGMLRGHNGRSITPEGYINRWMKQFSAPLDLDKNHHDPKFVLKMGSDFYDPILVGENQHYPSAEKLLKMIRLYGLPLVADRIEIGEAVSLSIYEHGELLIHLIDTGVYVWKLFKSSSPYGTVNAEHAITFKVDRVVFYEEKVEFVKIQNVLFQKQTDNTYVRVESPVSDFVKDYAKYEISQPGSYKKAIKTLRSLIENAPVAPMEMIATIGNTEHKLSSWKTNSRAKLIEIVGGEETTVNALNSVALLDYNLWYDTVSLITLHGYNSVEAETQLLGCQQDLF